MKGCLLQCSLRVFRLLTLAVQKLSQPSRAENITQRFSIVTAKSRCARLLDAREGELHFLHFFHVTVFAQPGPTSDIGNAWWLRRSIASPQRQTSAMLRSASVREWRRSALPKAGSRSRVPLDPKLIDCGSEQ